MQTVGVVVGIGRSEHIAVHVCQIRNGEIGHFVDIVEDQGLAGVHMQSWAGVKARSGGCAVTDSMIEFIAEGQSVGDRGRHRVELNRALFGGEGDFENAVLRKKAHRFCKSRRG